MHFPGSNHHHHNQSQFNEYRPPHQAPPTYAPNPVYGGAPGAAIGSEVTWRRVCNGMIPHDAIPLGRDTDNQLLFAARVRYNGALHVGKSRRDAKCYISYGGREIELPHHTDHEVLCGAPHAVHLIPCEGRLSRHIMQSMDLVEGGCDEDGSPLFVGVANTGCHGTPVGKCGPHLSALHYPYGDRECTAHHYSVLAHSRVGGVGTRTEFW
ncbi:hypothetical protein HDU98_006823 [Podochytrium sp. JEL0797]|nr:hypothetical protein HDU98_006823 [Podochytrium sp. JEL0797]